MHNLSQEVIDRIFDVKFEIYWNVEFQVWAVKLACRTQKDIYVKRL